MLTSRRPAVWLGVSVLLTMMSAVIVPAAAPVALAIPRSTHRTVARRTDPSDGSEHNGHYCDGCTPPLLYSGGPVMDTTGPTGVTITPIYWIPAGATPFPGQYQTIINRYIADVAADSGTSTNVYSINAEYYGEDGGTQTNITYTISAGTPIIDTEPFPADGCEVLETYTGCLTDDQIRAELERVTQENGVTTDLANFYPMFFPPGIMTQDLDGSNSDSAYCGYHRAFDVASGTITYGNEPFEASGCDAGQAPNGDAVADGAIGTLSHEINEALTDPTDTTAWNDSSGNEIGDICANDYGEALGSTDPDNPDTTLYNQVINGSFYYTQTEFSNAAFATLGAGNGCVQNADAVGAPVDTTSTAVGSVFTFAYPNGLDADGTSTSDISTSVSDKAHNIIEGDTINFSIYAVSGTGECGTLSARSVPTGVDGYANITYTSSKDDIVCAVVATDTQGGQASTGTVYQGTTQSLAPTATDTFPTSLVPGADPVLFTTEFTNPTDAAIVNAQVDFSIFPADGATDNVTADQIQLAYSTDGETGPFTPVALAGSTVGEGGIEGTLGDAAGTSVNARSTLMITYQISLADTVVNSGGGPLMSFEAYLDQVNPASGAGTNLADTASTDVDVASTGDASPDTASIDTSSGDTASADTSDGSSSTSDSATAGTHSDDSALSDRSSDGSSAVGVVVVVVALILIGGVAFFVVRRRRGR